MNIETQADYETELTVAAFRSPAQADGAVSRLEAEHIPPAEIERVPLGPGRYQVEDSSFGEENAGVRRGTVTGAPIGALVGLGVGLVIPGAGVAAAAGLAAAGAFCGGIIGGFVGSIVHAHFDDDVAPVIEVPVDGEYVLLLVHTTGAAGTQKAHARSVLHSAGALGFLDASALPPT